MLSLFRMLDRDNNGEVCESFAVVEQGDIFLPVTSSIIDVTRLFVSDSTLDETSSKVLVSGKLELRLSRPVSLLLAFPGS